MMQVAINFLEYHSVPSRWVRMGHALWRDILFSRGGGSMLHGGSIYCSVGGGMLYGGNIYCSVGGRHAL